VFGEHVNVIRPSSHRSAAVAAELPAIKGAGVMGQQETKKAAQHRSVVVGALSNADCTSKAENGWRRQLLSDLRIEVLIAY
jgi:hypothetical protein